MPAPPARVTILYRRLPHQVTRIPAQLLARSPTHAVLEARLRMRHPLRVDGRVVMADGWHAVWFVFHARGYDVARVYAPSGRFTGYYVDLLAPPRILWTAATLLGPLTDLFLDLWITPTGHVTLLDEAELEQAVHRRLLSRTRAELIRRRAHRLMRLSRARRFPPRLARTFPL